MLGSIILLAVLIFLNAVFASAEIAVISINEMKLYLLFYYEGLNSEGNHRRSSL